MKLKIKLTVIIIVMMVAIVAAISVILLTRASALQVEAAQENLDNMTGLYANDLKARYEVYLDTINTLSQIMNGYQSVDPAVRRTRYTEMIQSVMESNPNFVGIYTVWQPGVIDGRDAELAGTPETDSSGNFITWVSRDAGPLERRAYTDWQNALRQIRNVPAFNSPVAGKVAGKDTFVANITVPIIPDGTDRIVGLIGINIDLAVSQKTIEDLKPYGTGRALLISNDGTVAAHYDASKRGKDVEEVVLAIVGRHGVDMIADALKTGQSRVFSNACRICDVYPFYVGKSPSPWALMSSMMESTVLENVHQLTRFTIILAIAAIVAAAIVIFFVASSIAKPIVKVALNLKDISEGEGDLTRQISIKSKDEIGDLARYFNQTLEKIRALVATIKKQSIVWRRSAIQDTNK